MKKRLVAVIICALLVLGGVELYRHSHPAPPPAVIPVAKVKVAAVAKHNVPLVVNAIGQLLAPQTVMIKSKVAGEIQQVLFKPGQWVKQGQVLIRINDGDQQTRLANAKATYQMDRLKYLRYKRLKTNSAFAVSEDELSTALGVMKADKALVDNAKQILENTVVKAPFSGLVSTLASLSSANYAFGQTHNLGSELAVGAYLNAGDPIVLISNPDDMWVSYLVPQLYSAKLKYGQTISVTSTAYPKGVFKGVVNFISPVVDQVSQSFQVRAKIHNTKRKLRSGMNVFVQHMMEPKRSVIAVPGIALTPTLTGDQVYIVKNNKVAALPVKVGARAGTWVEIHKGLKVGDRVIVAGVSKVHPGSKVKVVAP